MHNREERQSQSLQEIYKPKPQLRSFKSQQNKQEQKQDLTHRFDILFDGIECQLIIEMKICKLTQNLNFINQSDFQNQRSNLQEDGNYMPQYINDQGVIENIHPQITEQKGIQIIAIYEDIKYIGILTEQEINQHRTYSSIEELFQQLLQELNNSQQDEELIKINQNGQNIELEWKLIIGIQNNFIKVVLKWDLLRQKDDQIAEKRIKSLQKLFIKMSEQTNLKHQQQTNQLQQLKEQQSDEFQRMKVEFAQLKSEIMQIFELSAIVPQLQNISNLYKQERNGQEDISIFQQFTQQQGSQITKQQIIQNKSDSSLNLFSIPTSQIHSKQFIQLNKSIDKSIPYCLYQESEISQNHQNYDQVQNLKKISEVFWIWPYIIEGKFMFKFRMKVVNDIRIVIGLDKNDNQLNNLAYGFQLCQKNLIIGQNTFTLKNDLEINDQVILSVDTNEHKFVLMLNLNVVLQSIFENQGQKELYLYVGSLNQIQDIKTIID